jgi:hypothetical protein
MPEKTNRQKTKHAQSSDGNMLAPSISREFIICSSNTRQRGISQGREHGIVILRNRRNL